MSVSVHMQLKGLWLGSAKLVVASLHHTLLTAPALCRRPVAHAELCGRRVCAGPRGGGPRVQVREGAGKLLCEGAEHARMLVARSEASGGRGAASCPGGMLFACTCADLPTQPCHPRVMYDRATMLWTLLWKIVKCHPRLKKLQGEGRAVTWVL